MLSHTLNYDTLPLEYDDNLDQCLLGDLTVSYSSPTEVQVYFPSCRHCPKKFYILCCPSSTNFSTTKPHPPQSSVKLYLTLVSRESVRCHCTIISVKSAFDMSIAEEIRTSLQGTEEVIVQYVAG